MSITWLTGNCLDILPTIKEQSVHCIVTSPPYYRCRDYGIEPTVWSLDKDCNHVWKPLGRIRQSAQRDNGKGHGEFSNTRGSEAHRAGSVINTTAGEVCAICGAWKGQLGLEPTPGAFIQHLCDIFDAAKPCLHEEGVLWVNLGDKFAAENYTKEGIKKGELIGIPWLFALEMRKRGWCLRQDICWQKCLSGGAFLYARTSGKESVRQLSDIVKRDWSNVELWDGEKWVKIVDIVETPRMGNELSLELRSGETISCTREHLWPTERGLVEAKDLRVGDILKSTLLPSPDLPATPELIPDEFGWLIGLYLAEGNKIRGNKTGIKFSLNSERSDLAARLESIVKCYNSNFSISISKNKKCASVSIYCPVITGLVDRYVKGSVAKNKHLSSNCWRRSNKFLEYLFNGYLDGDGHEDKKNNRYRLGLTNNDRLVVDLRTLAARLGWSIRLKRCFAYINGKKYKAYRGQLRKVINNPSMTKRDTEILRIGRSKGRRFYDIAVDKHPNLFSLSSGVLTHNSGARPESVKNRCTRSHEYIFMFTKKTSGYFYDYLGAAEPLKTLERYKRAVENKETYDSSKHKTGGDDYQAPYELLTRAAANVVFKGVKNRRSVWKFATSRSKVKHFAVYPETLPNLCIGLATSERGACAECGTQYRRKVRRIGDSADPGSVGSYGEEMGKQGKSHQARAGGWHQQVIRITEGWEKSCPCRTNEIVSAVVLDLFAGTGTTCISAEKLERDSIGIDLNSVLLDEIAENIEKCCGVSI